MLVEHNFKKLHQVQDYANLMFKSPKTLSNLFAKYSERSPLQIIADRLFLESKGLMLYTDLSFGEIGFELGFAEPAHFSRFFKKMAGRTPRNSGGRSGDSPNVPMPCFCAPARAKRAACGDGAKRYIFTARKAARAAPPASDTFNR